MVLLVEFLFAHQDGGGKSRVNFHQLAPLKQHHGMTASVCFQRKDLSCQSKLCLIFVQLILAQVLEDERGWLEASNGTMHKTPPARNFPFEAQMQWFLCPLSENILRKW